MNRSHWQFREIIPEIQINRVWPQNRHCPLQKKGYTAQTKQDRKGGGKTPLAEGENNAK
jgi:hypothetical protein